MKKLLLLACLFFFAAGGFAQQKIPDVKEVLNAACKMAAAERKNILLIFHASWCGWCRKMDSSINNKACKKLFADNYVIIHLTVHESGKKKNTENKGAEELLKQYKAFDSGLPFWVVLDKDGKLLKDSFLKNANGPSSIIGCPASEKEVAAFVQILKATSSLTDKELAVIEGIFRLNETN
ncbi:MAG: thioredoxin family protein [Chitinophagaceae bacterium]|nr:thioredoxin family protein [Chitinophagaceae bacterium]